MNDILRRDRDLLDALKAAIDRMAAGFEDLPSAPPPPLDEERFNAVLNATADRLATETPFFHPLYAGQMLRPPHPIARLAYTLALSLNPNNHALEGGRVSSEMEIECVRGLAGLTGWPQHLGHLTGGGTMANFEALWVGRQLRPQGKIVATHQAHYTHPRMSRLLGVPFEAITCDDMGRMDVAALEECLQRGEVATVVATLGTTATGAVDPLDQIVALRERYDFRLHVDAAYGGYFTLADDLQPTTRAAFDAVRHADSLVIDPHKHGLQPYGCGCVLFRDPTVRRFYEHKSPYTYFGSGDLHLGEISLECSRPGAVAVALWATMQYLPLIRGGEFAAGLNACRAAALELHSCLSADPRFLTATPPELDIVVWLPHAATASQASQRSRALFDRCVSEGLHLALVELPLGAFEYESAGMTADLDRVLCLRTVLIKPEHRGWVEEMWKILNVAMREILLSSV